MATQLADLAVKSFGRIDGMVINHGLLDATKINDVSMETFKHVYDVNVFSCLAMVSRPILFNHDTPS